MRKTLLGLAGLVLLSAATFWLFRHSDIPRATLEARYARPPSQFVTLSGGTRAHVRDRGPRDAPALLLLHGSNDSLLTWEPWANRLSDTFRIITVDLPGHGLTGAVRTGEYSEEAMVTFIGELADEFRLNTFAVGGNSMGGRIAARFTEEHPDRVTDLILVDAGGLGVRGDSAVEFAFAFLAKPVLARPLLEIAPRWLVVAGIHRAASRTNVITKQRIDAFWDFNHMEGARDAMIRRLSSGSSHVKDHLREIHVRTLILWGEEDRFVAVDAAHQYQAAIAGSKLIVYPHAGHLPQEEVADESAAAVRAFLARTTIR
jgi:pimeloyl-ACP methyl ester carboxylesterase